MVTGVTNLDAGTITAVESLPDLPGGTIDAVSSVTALPDLPGGTADLVTGLGTLGSISNIAAIHTAGTVSALPDLPGGTIDAITNVAGGTIVANEPSYSYSYAAAATSNHVVKAAAGFLHAILVGDAVGTSVIEVSDHASDGDGAVKIYLAGDNLGPALYPVNLNFGTGICADLTNQTHVTFIYK